MKFTLLLILFIFYIPVYSWTYLFRDFNSQLEIPASITARTLHGPLGTNLYNWTLFTNPEIVNFASLAALQTIALKASPHEYVSTAPNLSNVQINNNYTVAKPGRDNACALIYGKPHPNAQNSAGCCFNQTIYLDANGKWLFSEFDIIITDFSYDNTCAGQYWFDKDITNVFSYVNGNPNDGLSANQGYDRESVLLHELGHAVGMDHSSTSGTDMVNNGTVVPNRFVMEPSDPWTVSDVLGTVDNKIEFNPNVKRLEDEDCAYLNGSANSTLYFGSGISYNDFSKGMVGIYQETINNYTDSDFWDDDKSWWQSSSGLHCTNVWTTYPHVPGGVSAINLTAINKGNRLTWKIENDAELYKIQGFNIYSNQPSSATKLNPSLIRNGIKKYQEFNLPKPVSNNPYLLEVVYRDGSSEILPFER